MNNFCNSLKKPPLPKGGRIKNKNQDILDQTTHLWRHRTGGAISREDAKEMVNNIAGFFRVLLEWDRKIYSESHHQDKIMGRHVNRTVHKRDYQGDEDECPTAG